MTSRVVTGSRLHFGLMRLPPAEPWPNFPPGAQELPRYFGGIGIMVDEPRVEVVAEQASEWQCRGPLCGRAELIASALGQTHNRIDIGECPPEHVGLGVGTQLSMAVGTALTRGNIPPIDLASRLGRGVRSGIGIHGFAHGGFIVDAGKSEPNEIGHLAGVAQVPTNWLFVLLTPSVDANWFGQQEVDAFTKLTTSTDEKMPRLIDTSILPAMRQADLTTFGAALTEYNARAGELFRPVQGDRYSHPIIGSMVAELVQRGFAGAGQTSWGPTVFAITDDTERIDFLRRNPVTHTSCSMVVTRARNQPATLRLS